MSRRPCSVCTLFEGDYHYGVGGLVNSLVRQGYNGTVFAGSTGETPEWLSSIGNVLGTVKVAFVPLRSGEHLTHRKAEMIEYALEAGVGVYGGTCYFDPDITVAFPWGFYESWVLSGVAVCADVNGWMDPEHPKRILWKRMMMQLGMSLPRVGRSYVNAGFVGIARVFRGFLDDWKAVKSAVFGGQCCVHGISNSDDYRLWFPDQDILNIALMATSAPLCIAGDDAMAFRHGVHYMHHSVGNPKPWQKNYIACSLQGSLPSRADIAYWNHAGAPVPLFTKGYILSQRISMQIAAAIGRVTGRR